MPYLDAVFQEGGHVAWIVFICYCKSEFWEVMPQRIYIPVVLKCYGEMAAATENDSFPFLAHGLTEFEFRIHRATCHVPRQK